MTILSDREIKKRCETSTPMISPFIDHQIRDGGLSISYGLSSYGYDIRIGRKFKIFHNAYNAIVDPKQFDKKAMLDYEAVSGTNFVIIPPNSFVLGHSHEKIHMLARS